MAPYNLDLLPLPIEEDCFCQISLGRAITKSKVLEREFLDFFVPLELHPASVEALRIKAGTLR
jgi:hypothetical protein